MSHPRTALGDLTEVIMGQAPPGVDCNKEGRGTIFVKAGEFAERRPLIREWTTKPLRLARKGDVLVCVVGATAGKVNESIDCAIGRSVAAVRPNLAKIEPTYLYHYLTTQVQLLRSRSQGMAQGVITLEMLHEALVPLPTLTEQRRIAAILDQAAALRAKRRQALARLDALTQSIFIEMFGDPATNAKYERTTIRELVTAGSGKSPKSVILQEESEIPIYGGNGINGWASKALVEEPVLVFGRVGQQCGITTLTTGPAWITDNAIIVKVVRPEELALVYLKQAFDSTNFSSRVKHLDLPFINQDMILDFPLPLPPRTIQQRFVECVEKIHANRSVVATSEARLNDLFASLQHRAFRGEL